MSPPLNQEQSASNQHLAQSLLRMAHQQIAQANQRLAGSPTSPLLKALWDLLLLMPTYVAWLPGPAPLQRYASVIMVLLESTAQIAGASEPPSWSKSQQDKRIQLILTSTAWIKSTIESPSQNVPPEVDLTNLEQLIVILIGHVGFWKDMQQNGEGKAEDYAIKVAEHALNVAQSIEPSKTVQEMISDTYMIYWQNLERRRWRTKKPEDLDVTVRALRRSGQFLRSPEAAMICKVTLANLLWTMWRLAGPK